MVGEKTMVLHRKLVGALAMLLLAGCSTTHHFQAELPVREGSFKPAEADSFGGAVSKAEVFNCGENGVADVFVKRSFFESLLSTLTLGGYQRTKIEYVCAKELDGDVPTLGGTAVQRDTQGGN